MLKFLKDITTCKDNQTHDVVRVAMTAITGTAILVLILGVYMYCYSYLQTLSNPNAKLFDVQTFFTSTSTYVFALGGFLASGSGALLLKKTTEPDGTTTETESITKGKQPDIVTQTTVIQP